MQLPLFFTILTLGEIYKFAAIRHVACSVTTADSAINPEDKQLTPQMQDLDANQAELLQLFDDIKKGVVFQLYTRGNEENPEILDVLSMAKNNTKFKYFDPERPVRICVHGWNADDTTMTSIRIALLEHDDLNVIMMDWTKLSIVPYRKARPMVTHLGLWLSYFLDVLVDVYGLNVSDFHIIGYSLGAHISGEAGRYTTKGKVGRITGLDPAGMSFTESLDVLSYDAAEFVDIVHTCGNVVGYWEPTGHADFYPNGGTCLQPGCMLSTKPTCSHKRAIDLFAESVNSAFISWPFEGGPEGNFPTDKDKLVFMGYHTNKSTRGVYYLETSGHPPYAVSNFDNAKKHLSRKRSSVKKTTSFGNTEGLRLLLQ